MSLAGKMSPKDSYIFQPVIIVPQRFLNRFCVMLHAFNIAGAICVSHGTQQVHMNSNSGYSMYQILFHLSRIGNNKKTGNILT